MVLLTYNKRYEMDESFIAEFATALSVSARGPPPVYLAADGGVYAARHIRAGTILGEIIGEPRYFWEVDHGRYMVVDSDYVIDVTAQWARGDLLVRVREENESMNASNCTIDGEGRFFLRAFADVSPGTELVYCQYVF